VSPVVGGGLELTLLTLKSKVVYSIFLYMPQRQYWY
jgi:hypothetical protein